MTKRSDSGTDNCQFSENFLTLSDAVIACQTFALLIHWSRFELSGG